MVSLNRPGPWDLQVLPWSDVGGHGWLSGHVKCIFYDLFVKRVAFGMWCWLTLLVHRVVQADGSAIVEGRHRLFSNLSSENCVKGVFAGAGWWQLSSWCLCLMSTVHWWRIGNNKNPAVLWWYSGQMGGHLSLQDWSPLTSHIVMGILSKIYLLGFVLKEVAFSWRIPPDHISYDIVVKGFDGWGGCWQLVVDM